MSESELIPFFQGNLDQIKELQSVCHDLGLATTPVKPPPGCGGS